jgi:hypothetical protein
MYRESSVRLVLVLAVLLACPSGLAGQLISLKTVPLAAGDQFLIFPSENLAMGGVAIALDDALLDPFVNPAMGSRIGEPQVFSSPTFYSVSNRAGSARTLPVGAAFNSGGWFGGAFAALQNLKRGERFFGPFPLTDDIIPPPNALSSRSATNKYTNLSIGKTVGPGLSIGVSAFLADLSAIDGVEHLYALASGISQRGDMVDLRFGLSKEFTGDRKLEAVLLHHRFNMTHDVAYVDWVVVDSLNWIWETQTRLEENLDRSLTWGAHVGYDQPVGTNGWRVGGIFTANRKSHPKIPNYEIMNIPRDPGHSNAFDIGVGLAKVTDRTKFGLDLVYEPATSETWAEAVGPVETASGDTIPHRGKTVENSFGFSNAFVNMGVTHDAGPVSLQLGLRVSAYDFHLDQWDNVEETFRRQDEDWMEWVPSWGLTARLADLELRYLGRVTTGTGRPGVGWTGAAEGRVLDAAAANDILLAPSGPLTLQDATVMTHQVSIAIPIR